MASAAPPALAPVSDDRQIAHGAGHGEDGAAHVHLLGGELGLLEEAAAHGVGPQVVLAGQRAAHARREHDFRPGQPLHQHVVELRGAVAARAQRLQQAGVGQRAEVDRRSRAAAAKERFQAPISRLADRPRQTDSHRLRERRIGARENGAAARDFERRRAGVRWSACARIGGLGRFNAAGQREIGEAI